jgi:hypothetical protein
MYNITDPPADVSNSVARSCGLANSRFLVRQRVLSEALTAGEGGIRADPRIDPGYKLSLHFFSQSRLKIGWSMNATIYGASVPGCA